MALSWVRVEGVKCRDVFVNGNYDNPVGTVGRLFRVETGRTTFETLDEDGVVDHVADVEVHRHPRSQPQVVQLRPVGLGVEPGCGVWIV